MEKVLNFAYSKMTMYKMTYWSQESRVGLIIL